MISKGGTALELSRPVDLVLQHTNLSEVEEAARLIREWYVGQSMQRESVTTKEAVRQAHLAYRREVLTHAIPFLLQDGRDFLEWFADGSEVRPEDVRPEIVPVLPQTSQSKLFRLASLWWSVPVSQGFGRRQRFLVLDKSNQKLIGIFALGDPVFNLSARDRAIGWTARDREFRLRYVVDAFVLGALPPYSNLLCGKLIAALTTAIETENSFCRRYRGSETVIRKKRENAQLALLTTSAVFGRSSVYDRLRVNDELRFDFVGITKGYGHFHVPADVFAAMVDLLERTRHPYAHGNRFGNGPNWKIRVIRVALKTLDLDERKLNHGFHRGVYIAPLAANYREFLRGEQRSLQKGIQESVETIAEKTKNRWIIPRSRRNGVWRNISGAEMLRTAVNSALRTEVL